MRPDHTVTLTFWNGNGNAAFAEAIPSRPLFFWYESVHSQEAPSGTELGCEYESIQTLVLDYADLASSTHFLYNVPISHGKKRQGEHMTAAKGDALTTCYDIFSECVRAIDNNELIQAVSAKDKEFHFQNWFQQRLSSLRLDYDEPGRNTYPDFRLVHHPEGYEIKGLAVPGRDKNYDSNSQIPTGIHHGRIIFYVFGRYPQERTAKEYPVIDLVLCHGDFLNVDHEYIHKNKSVKGFGSYGDIMIRDRKMYVVPTPFALTAGTIGNKTLIVPENYQTDNRFTKVGDLVRVEAKELVIGYSFDLRTNALTAEKMPNPNAGKEHCFSAYRLQSQSGKQVSMAVSSPNEVLEMIDDEAEDE